MPPRRCCSASRPGYPIRPMVTRRADDARRVVAPLLSAVLALGLLCVAAFTGSARSRCCWPRRRSPSWCSAPRSPSATTSACSRPASTTRFSDGLTGLGNRRKLMVDLDRTMEEVRAGDAAKSDPLRPRRLQALQRHLRPPGRGHPAGEAGGQPELDRRRPRRGLPDRRRRVLRARPHGRSQGARRSSPAPARRSPTAAAGSRSALPSAPSPWGARPRPLPRRCT